MDIQNNGDTDLLARSFNNSRSINMADQDTRYRLVLLGASRTGKSSLIHMFLNGKFLDTYKETVEDLHYREFTVDDKTIKVDILDTAGNMEFPAMRRLSIATSHAFILVYSVDSMSSFEEIRRIIEQIKEQRSNYAEIPIVVVGNKTDRTSVREVEEQQVHTMVNELGPLHCRIAECTALDRASVIDVFLKLLSLVQLSAARQLSPILRRKVSERLKKKEFEEKNDKSINRSRSLIRRTSMKKKAATSSASSGSGDKNCQETPDCLVS
ncbi:unnamed protein product [Rotaria socialis]|uniref:GTP-binding protein Rhes n=1 Tax=Rotaria socialis TaxID=392032 RepID=A0A818ZEV6_9BILA|nr:unnamed protein product [Rotaria socialis]CAF3402553.1 unnamed protein product [Rotaria socialis]CAF3453725.1 unnamed protein product [Rotaria socialis]CAF3514590.1 unnamed protein product [Rotaria socialis]CAF3763137.1 unnamed protein product [Rotaria socialis]